MTKNERMKQLLKNGNVLKEGIVRGDTVIVDFPKQSKSNDVKMRKQSGILYGNTKYTDEQIVYFYNKHKGNARAAARELRMWASGYVIRLNRLGLKPKGKCLKKYTDKQIIAAYHKHKGNSKNAVEELNISDTAYYIRTKLLGLSSSKTIRKLHIDKQIHIVYQKHKGNRKKIALELGICLNSVRKRLIKLKLIKVGKKSGVHRLFTDKKLRYIMKQTHGNILEASLLLKCHINTIYAHLKSSK